MLPALEDLPCHQELLVALYLLQHQDPSFPLLHHHRHHRGAVPHPHPHHRPLRVAPLHPLAPRPWMG